MADTVRLLCPQCRTAYRLKVAVRPGATVKCSKCGAGMVVPEPAAAPPIARKSEFAGSSDDRHVSLAPEREAPTMALPDGESEEGAEMVLKEADPNAGRYIEQAVIGRGGMGEVALCIDRNTRRPVALKRILPHAASDPARRARFVEEAQVTAQLEHPNIVPVHDLDRTPDGTIYFTMKLVKGRSLADILKDMKSARPYAPRGDDKPDAPRPPAPPPAGFESRGRVSDVYPPAGEETRGRKDASGPSLSDLLQVFLKVCDGVAFAHSRGVIHRDLKPANIMVGEYGEVLVMDWGLAKLLGAASSPARPYAPSPARPYAPRGDEQSDAPRPPASLPPGFPPEGFRPSGGYAGNSEAGRLRGIPSRRSETFGREGERVVSDRQEDALSPTIDGSTVGTPAYMSPEQANGELDKIDPRSDIYSLGAILYEILTLERAIEGETPMMVLVNASRNRIVPIEKRAAGRHVPRELAAIAMKCLAKSRAARYRSVLDLRRDIALFLEGRSVSAKPDTFAQAAVKLVKRNKGVSASIAAAAVIIVAITTIAFLRVTGAMQRALRGEQAAVKERKAAQESEGRAIAAQQQERATALAASERFAKQAALVAENYRWTEAQQRLVDAQAVCPDGPWAAYANARFAQIKGDHEGAVKLFNDALKTAPGHPDIKSALDRSASLLHRVAEARRTLKEGAKLANWQVAERIGDTFSEVEDWAEAEGAYAQAVELLPPNVPREDLQHKLGSARAWLACRGFDDSIRNLPAQEQLKRVMEKLAEIHGVAIPWRQFAAEGDRLSFLQFAHSPLRHIQPLRGLPLKKLQFGVLQGPGVTDLSPLRGMPLRDLDLSGSKVADLSPLKGMALERLVLDGTNVKDLSPLQGLPLTYLSCQGALVSDLSPLHGMPLTHLELHSCDNVSDLTPLRGMPLTHLGIYRCGVTDLSPLHGMPLESLNAHILLRAVFI